jgi:uncharacterized membrane protein
MGSDVIVEESSLSPSRPESEVSVSPLVVTAGLTAAGIAGRIGLQHIPSVEPLIAVAVASGFYFGAKEGFIAGASGYYLSNFMVYGGQGPWTVFQVFGAGLAGLSGALLGKYFDNKIAFFTSILVGVTAFEILVNLGSLGFSFSTGGLTYLLGALPFTFTHFASTIGFGLMLYGSREKIGFYRED